MSYDELMKKYQDSQIEIENLKLELQNLKRMIFGSKSESIKKPEKIIEGEQSSLFSDKIQTEEEIVEQVEKNIEEITVYRKKKAKTRKAGVKRSNLKEIEIEIKHIKLPVDENGKILTVCPTCGGELKEIGKKIIRQEIEYIPAKLKIIEYVEYRYKCKECGEEGSENANSVFVNSKVPNPIISHSFASPSLVGEVIYQKYFSGMPLYRQEKMWYDKGLILPRNMMANWVIKVSEYYLESLWKLMLKELKKNCEVLHRR